MTDRILEHEDFAGLVGAEFTVRGAQPPVTLTLIDSQAARQFAPQFRMPFTLLFSTRDQRVFAQQTFPLHNAGMGDLDIFLVPIDQTDDGVTYQAVFN